MKKFWKILGLGALVAGLTPYKVEKNEETGENSYQALLWRITSAPGSGENKREIGIDLGEGTLTAKLMGNTRKAEESHLFSDELSVEYTAPVDETVEKEDVPETPETTEVTEAAEASESPETTETPEIPETPEAGENEAE